MALTPDQIVEETRDWPSEKLANLVDRLACALHATIEPEIENAWRNETRRRLAELESGQVKSISGEEVSAQIRKIVGR